MWLLKFLKQGYSCFFKEKYKCFWKSGLTQIESEISHNIGSISVFRTTLRAADRFCGFYLGERLFL